MDNSKLLKQQLLALQANCASIIQITESVVSLLEKTEEKPSIMDIDSCLHPQEALQDARTMGFPNRFMCVQCKTYVEVADEQVLQAVRQEIN